ncbi:hypothetical protein [Alteribacillus iranensis]|uniref:LysM domain-containing protein n=1 Tax=Alteribacillus iranensis TaxID=930128 RepID=A0A1I1ZGD6_9BACI|nr:hypothetical protein [Alteribacillus iranensis]SFE29623.1 hypothetical protein SAMN05192532_101173 [Alteribacillus iranensis]
MKRLLLFIVIVVIGIAVYYDFSEGTLSQQSSGVQTNSSPSEDNTNIDNHISELNGNSSVLDGQKTAEVTVERGQTVLTIVEKLHSGPVPASIQQISDDFQKLNDGLSPNEIKADATYIFPLYTTSP